LHTGEHARGHHSGDSYGPTGKFQFHGASKELDGLSTLKIGVEDCRLERLTGGVFAQKGYLPLTPFSSEF
jgi:hypothetical protein